VAANDLHLTPVSQENRRGSHQPVAEDGTPVHRAGTELCAILERGFARTSSPFNIGSVMWRGRPLSLLNESGRMRKLRRVITIQSKTADMIRNKIGTQVFGPQLELPLAVEAVTPQSNGIGTFLDPAFARNKSLPIHRWVPWIAGFSADFVKDAITRYTNKKSTILDPFAGVGTTLVEGQMSGHSVIGFEINPYAALASRIKTIGYWYDAEKLEHSIAILQSAYKEKERNNYIPVSEIPPGFKTRNPFYSPAVLRKVLIIQDLIAGTKDAPVRDLFRLAFAATMVRYSNYSYEPSLGQRRSSGKPDVLDHPVLATVTSKLQEMVHDIHWLQSTLPKKPKRARVIADTIFSSDRLLASNSIDLVVTSPPYLNNYHYNRNTRPQVYWLGFASGPDDMSRLETMNFGKYWQTVRDRNKMDLEFHLPGSDLSEKLETIANLNSERGPYGGLGWANYAVSYFNDCNKLARCLKKLLKRNGIALVVIGNSIIQGVEIATDKYFAEICTNSGLIVDAIETPRSLRVGNSIIKSSVRVAKAESNHRLYEAVVILRKR